MTAKSYADSNVLILGGSSGVGLATAHRLATAGVRRLAVTGRSQSKLDTAVEELESRHGIDVAGFPFDASDLTAATAGVGAADAFLGGADVLVSSVTGAATPELLHTLPADALAGDLTGLLFPPIFATRLVLPGMYERGTGSVVLIASDAAKVATPGETVIGAAMAGIVMFARTVAMEAKRHNVRVNAVTPSLVLGTPTAERVTKEGFSAKLFAAAAKQAALGVPVADDLAELIVFLAGPGSERLTGQAISVNGGISAA